MRTIATGLICALFLNACADSDEASFLHHYEMQKRYHKRLLQTEKLRLPEEGETLFLLTATYLYDPENKKGDERFIVGIYADNDKAENGKIGIDLSLDGAPPEEVAALEKDDPLLRDLSFKIAWHRYYLVRFPHTEKRGFNLVVNAFEYGKGALRFAKKPKYVFSKKAF